MDDDGIDGSWSNKLEDVAVEIARGFDWLEDAVETGKRFHWPSEGEMGTCANILDGDGVSGRLSQW